MNIFKKKRSKLSRRITWRVILIVSFINVLIIGAIIFFFFVISTMISGMRASYVIDGLNRQFESMHKAEQVFQPHELQQTIEEMEKTTWKEFYVDPSRDTKKDNEKDDNEIGFSIQIIDSQGKCIAGTDSIDLSILNGKQVVVLAEYNMMDLKGTPYYISTAPIAHTDWTLVVFQHYNMVFMWGQVMAIFILFFMAIGAVIIFFFTRRSIRRAIKPLGILSDTTQEVAKGNFDTVLPTFKRHDEISQLRDSFDTMQHSLSRYVEELKASTAAKASIESELNVAHNIQMSMLPKSFPAFPERKDIDLYGSLTPAKGVGGDLFDFFIRDTTPSSPLQVSTSSSPLQGGNQGGEKLFFCVGDVSGKGVPAALVMAVCRTLFRNVAAHTDSPAQIVKTMNTNISEGNDNNMFVTLFVGALDLATGRLSYCNGGHNAPYIQSVSLPVEPNLPIGIFPDWEFVEQKTVMEPGSTIFLYTDGLTEAENAVQDQFGEDRMTTILAAQTDQSASPETLISVMTDAVHEFVGDTEQSDDLTMLAIKYTKI